ncbi:hemolysin family protein [Citricoccus sp. NPDC079358]|jgi:CBS domain containing-hemolysin-like protein|uniref:hemolysin family protein n=1 Tax=Citricoccus sp. NPDC079358 TaxID=3154653 RepID=UPI00344F469D
MIEAVLLLLLGLVVIGLIIAANGYFVAQEFAYMSVDRVRLQAQAKAGDAAAERALKITRRTSFMLSGAQLGITVTGLLVGYVAEPMVGQALGVLLGGAGIPPAVSISVGTVLALVVATVVQMIFGELYPKNLAIAAPEPLARGLARSTSIYLAVFGWIIVVFDKSANALLRLLRIEPVHDVDSTATAQDLDRMVADSRNSGDLPEELSVLIDRVLDFPDQDVEHAMIPRSLVDTVSPDTTIGEVRALMAREHTRYPVISPDLQPVGVVHLTDVLVRPIHDSAPVETIMRDPLLVPTLMPLPDALVEFTRTRSQLACVIDEYGGFAGVLTVEDMAEELVGELTDEHDGVPVPEIAVEQDDVWRVAGNVHVDELERTVGHPLPDGDVETVSGLVISELGELPEAGQTVVIALPGDPREVALDEPVHRHLHIEVIEVARHVPCELVVRLLQTTNDTDQQPPQRAGLNHKTGEENR